MISKRNYIDILNAVYPYEMMIAGEEAALIIIEGNDIEEYEAKGGSNFNIASDLATISTAVVIIKNVIEIYKSLSNKRDKDQIQQKTKDKLEKENIVFDESLLKKTIDQLFIFMS